MQTNLIQNFVQTQNTQPSLKKKKEAPKFDIHHELANRTFIRPLNGRGRLVKSNIIDAPANMVKSFAYDMKALKSAIDGEANDHQLGKLNDLGMKLGGLTIAGYLYTKKQTPLTKAMEFVGLGSFFASMALWPKIAIQLPAYLIHGFNVQQQYEDSFGRKKPFYQDPQFLPWDLYSDKEIHKIGDRLGVPKDIPNRREHIQEKMKKIAIQNNTLWMLTAGFATPIMSALICNALEKPLAKPLSAMRNSNNNDLLTNFNKIVSKKNYNEINENIENVISINRNKPLTDSLLKELANAMTPGLSGETADIIVKDLKKILKTENYIINSNSIVAISDNCKKALKEIGIDEEIVDTLIKKPEALTQYFENKGFYGNDYPAHEMDRVFNEFAKDLRIEIFKYIKENPEKGLSDDDAIDMIRQLVNQDNGENPILKGLLKERGAVLNAKNEDTIKVVAKAMNNLQGNFNVLNKYILNQLGTTAETSIADFWNNTVDKLVKELKISKQELADTRGDRLLVKELVMNKFDNLAADPVAYKRVVTTLLDQMSELTKKIKPTEVSETVLNKKENTKYNKQVDAIFKQFEVDIRAVKDFKEGDMEGILSQMLGSRKNFQSPRGGIGSYRDFLKNVASDRLIEVKSSFFRILNALDLHRRIANGDPSYYPALHSGLPREAKEDVVELSKNISISGHTSDFLTKFFQRRNLRMDSKDFSNIEIKSGKMVRKYTEQNRKGNNQVNVPQAKEMFIESMRLQYENPVLDETASLLKKYKEINKEFLQYRQTVLKELGNASAIEKELHKVSKDVSEASSALMFRLTGAATDDIIANFGQQSFNSNKWLKMFGTAGAVLLGVTVLSQFFFGKMKLPQAQTQESKKG